MGKHSTPRGEASTKQGIDSATGRRDQDTTNYQGKHRKKDVIAGSDLPPRGKGLKDK